jgi:hypothetical protein
MPWLLFVACVAGPPSTGDGVSSTDDDPSRPSPTACSERDEDGDGVDACDDCDEGDPLVFPGAGERCDGIDDDCDTQLDPEEQVDLDADGAPDCAMCDEAGFWAGTRGLGGDALVAALHELTADQDCRSYSAETDFLFTALDKLSDGTVECVYTGRHTAVGTEKPDATDMNTEHTWPQSQGADVEPMKCDLHHLFVTDAAANGARGNLPLSDVSAVDSWWDETGESALGETGDGVLAFEPRDVHKGNAARALLYFAMRYDHPIAADDLARYKAWNTADPPDDAERARSMAIRARQGEANPYVVCSDLVDAL